MSFYRSLVLVASFSALTAVSGCAKDPSKDAPAATVSEPAPEEAKPLEKPAEPAAPAIAPATAPSPAAAAPVEGLALSGKIGFVGSKVTGSHSGEFREFKGTVALNNGKPEGGKLDFTVQTASLFTTDANPFKEKLEGHLKSPDFFDVEKFPTAAFASSGIAAGGANGATHTVKGKLTLHGVTKDIEFPATIAVAGKDITGKTEFSINRKDFGLVYAGKPDDLIRDGVVIKIDVKATLP